MRCFLYFIFTAPFSFSMHDYEYFCLLILWSWRSQTLRNLLQQNSHLYIDFNSLWIFSIYPNRLDYWYVWGRLSNLIILQTYSQNSLPIIHILSSFQCILNLCSCFKEAFNSCWNSNSRFFCLWITSLLFYFEIRLKLQKRSSIARYPLLSQFLCNLHFPNKPKRYIRSQFLSK